MKIAISQPTYLPWLGYFDLIDQVDAFVVLDTVQFEKRSWQQRNRIKTPSGLSWLTVPVAVHGRFEQAIRDVTICEGPFSQKHLRSLEANYAHAPFFHSHISALSSILAQSLQGTRLIDLNLRLLGWLMQVLGITTPLVLASALQQAGKRTELLANICRKLDASDYLSPLGSAEYLLDEMQIFSDYNVEVVFQNYTHPEYKQLFPPFVPYACVLDLVFNEGERSMEIIRSGRGKPFLPHEVAARVAECKTI